MDNTDPMKTNTLLVIDDEAGLRDMLAFGLPDRGYRVVTAGHTQQHFWRRSDRGVCGRNGAMVA